MPKPRVPVTNAALKNLREAKGLTQAELSAKVLMAEGTISAYECGEPTLPKPRLDEMMATIDVAPELVDAFVEAQEVFDRQFLEPAIPLAHGVPAAIWTLATASGRAIHEALFDGMITARASLDRQEAAEVWQSLRAVKEEKRRLVIERAPGVATWALVERLSIESIEEAPHRPDQAMHLARLALRTAEAAPASKELRGCLIGFAHGHIGNAWRVAGDLHAGKAAFVQARRFWPVGMLAPAGLLSEARLFALEASLLRDQRLFGDAIALLDRALALDGEAPETGRLYLNQSAILEQQGDHEGSLEALRAAKPWIDEAAEPRLYSVLLFNLCSNLVDLSRFAEACEVLPDVRERLIALENDFDLIRLLWLDGRIHEGLGRTEQAITAIDQVRRKFTFRRKPDDAALAGLDLAAIYLGDGRNAETRDLARQMAKVFGSFGIKREEFAAVRLFVEAAEQEVATVEMARRAAAAIRAVRRAREADEFCV